MELVLLAACTYAAVRLAAPLARALEAALEASRRPAAPTLKSLAAQARRDAARRAARARGAL